MESSDMSNNKQIREVLDRIRSMERRIRILESEIGIKALSKINEGEEGDDSPSKEILLGQKQEGKGIESGFGEYGLAWIGNIVLLFGISFLMQYIQNKGSNVISTVFGYGIVTGIFILYHYLKNSYAILSRTFNYTAFILLYYVTLRLHYFHEDPLILNNVIAIALLLAVVIFQLLFALRQRSVFITGMTFVMIVFTALLTDSTHTLLAIISAVCVISTYLLIRFGWWRLHIFSVFLVYLGFLMWFLGNPLMGGPLEFISDPNFSYIYLFGIGAVFSLAAIESKKHELNENIALVLIFINGFLFSTILSLYVITFFKTDYIALFLIIAIFCLGFSTFLKSRSAWKLIPAFYALYGFLALSISVHGIYGFPNGYWLLSIQSILVLIMALWFRNKVIVLMNAILFVMLFIIYLGSSESVNEVNYSFAVVALLTARILNWKKDRLEIKTEMLRNIYLFSAFIMVPFAFYHSLPANFITLSWTILAITYFVLSIVLKNTKYRYIALGTMLATALHLFMVDLARIEIVYRVIAFLSLAVISLFISVYYTGKMKKLKKEENSE